MASALFSRAVARSSVAISRRHLSSSASSATFGTNVNLPFLNNTNNVLQQLQQSKPQATTPVDLNQILQVPQLGTTPQFVGFAADTTLNVANVNNDSTIADNINDDNVLQMMNRNNRKPKRANHGARPCSRWARRMKKNKIGRRKRE